MKGWPEFVNREGRRTLLDPGVVEAVLEQDGWAQIITKGDVYGVREDYDTVVARLREAAPRAEG